MYDEADSMSWSTRSTEFPEDVEPNASFSHQSSISRCASEPSLGSSPWPQSPRKALMERPDVIPVDNAQMVRHATLRHAQLSDIPFGCWPSGRHDFNAALERLQFGRKMAAIKLGSADAIVERARLQQLLLRQRGEEVRWHKLEAWHQSNIARAAREVSQGGNVAELDFAVRLAHDSELGPGHRVVADGQAQVSCWRKRRHHEAALQLEAHHKSQLAVAAEHGDLDVWEAVIHAAAVAIGSAHPIVEGAREARKRHRWHQQHLEWQALVEEHKCQIFQALASEDATFISNVLQASARVLGHGHPVIMEGKQSLLELRKLLQRERQAAVRQRCSLMLEGLVFEAEQALAPLYF